MTTQATITITVELAVLDWVKDSRTAARLRLTVPNRPVASSLDGGSHTWNHRQGTLVFRSLAHCSDHPASRAPCATGTYLGVRGNFYLYAGVL
jgi:hypothetical protein